MPNSPLDGSFESSKKRLKPKWGLAIFALFATIIGGGVFAINIAINTGTAGNVEFGQGVATVVACDEDVIVTPTSIFDGAAFILDSIIVSNLDQASCSNKTLIVKALDSNPSVIAEASTQVPSGSATDYSITFDPAASPTATAVEKITVESQN